MKRVLPTCLGWYLRVNSRWVLALGRLLYDLEIHGSEHLPSDGPLLIVARGSSRMEFFQGAFFFSVLKEYYGPTADQFWVKSRIYAWLTRELGAFAAYRGGSLTATPLMAIYKLLRQGKIIFMVAEGERAWDGRLQPLRPGAAWLALRTRAPVIVSMLHGGYDIRPRWASWPHLTGKLILKIGKPFYLCDAPCDRVTKDMLQEANQRLLVALEDLSGGYMLQRRKGERCESN